MTYILLLALGLAALLTVYAVGVRPWLKAQPWAQPFFAWVVPLESALFKNSETILFARLKMLTGLVLTVAAQAGTLDLTPLMPFIPTQHQALVQAAFNLLPLIITVVGWADERLRKTTTKPLELVAAENKPLPPQAAIAVADAEIAKETAVKVIQQTGA